MTGPSLKVVVQKLKTVPGSKIVAKLGPKVELVVLEPGLEAELARLVAAQIVVDSAMDFEQQWIVAVSPEP